MKGLRGTTVLVTGGGGAIGSAARKTAESIKGEPPARHPDEARGTT